MVAQTRKSGNNSPRKLKFNEKLVGKGLSTDALLKKLKVLHTELAELDQEYVDLKSLGAVCKELVSTSILLHKDKGVKAYAACCLADLLRLYAPDAPYTGDELRDIFQFFFRQLAVGLKGSDAPYYNEYFHLLESLSTVKSVVLVCDLPQAEELMTTIFRDFFGLVRQDLAKNIEMFMSDILIALIDECQMLPSEVLETIMAQFMDKNARLDQPAYRLAVEVCNATSDKLQRHVCQYFTDNIVQHAQNEDFEEVGRCHALIKRLNHACPSLLHNVVPQLEEELRVEEVQLRQMATQVLGEMFADKGGGDLERKYPSTWALWLVRKNDKSPVVRLAFVEGCKGLLLHHRVELRVPVEDALRAKLLDPDEKVRAAVCKLYAQLDFETSLHYVSLQQLRNVGERTLDKKQNVRQEALTSIGRLYNIAYPEIENNDPAAIRQFAWIPQQILQSISTAMEVKGSAAQAIAEYVLPLPKNGDEEAWTDRLLVVMRYLDEKAVLVLMSINGLKLMRPSPFDRYIQCCIENNGGVIDEDEEAVKRRLNGCTRLLSTLFPDPQRATEDLQAFSKMNEQRSYKLLKTCIDPQTDLKGLEKGWGEFSRRVEQSDPSILPTMMSFVRQASLWIFNQSSVPTLVKRLQKGDHHEIGKGTSQVQLTADNAQALLVTISKFCPAVYRPHVSEFTKAIANEKNPRLVEVSLQALAAVCRWQSGLTPSDKRTTDRLMRYARGTHPRHAKFAARILAYARNKDELCSEMVDFISGNLHKADPDLLVAHIAVLVEMVRFAPDSFEQKSDIIIAFLLKETLLRPSTPDPASMDVEDETEWMEEEDLPPLVKAKILALKLCRHRCLVHASSETAQEIATPVLKMFFTFLENGGALSEDSQEDPRAKSRLRLQAACSLAQLAVVDKFSSVTAPNFVLLAVTVQDSCFNVRFLFLTKLMLLISTRKLPPRFNLIPFLTAHDPEDEIKDKARVFAMYTFKRSPQDIKLSHWEMIFIQLLHVLAHHPDFGLEGQQILDLAKYIRLYLSAIATADNISLLYHLAQKCKTVRDAESHLYSEHLYAASELAQELIKNHAKAHQWSLSSYPGKVKLPSDIFRPLPNTDAQKTIMKTVYLPEDILKSLDGLNASAAKEKAKADRKTSNKKKASQKNNGTSSKRPRPAPKKRKRDEDEDDDDDEDDNIEDDSDEGGSDGSSVPRSVAVQSESDDDDGEGGEMDPKKDLGRGARSRAKAKSKRRAKRQAKSTLPATDD